MTCFFCFRMRASELACACRAHKSLAKGISLLQCGRPLVQFGSNKDEADRIFAFRSHVTF